MNPFTCLIDPGSCIASGWHSLIAAVPWWAWIVLGLIVLGLVWKLAGVPGLIAVAFGAGFIAGSMARGGQATVAPPATPRATPKRTTRLPFPPIGSRPKTLQDMFRDGLK